MPDDPRRRGAPAGAHPIGALREFYGLQPVPPGDLFQFFVWEILSEHAVDARRDLAWQALRRIAALTPDALYRVPARDLLAAIAIAGARREEKVEQLRALAADFKRHRDALDAAALSHAGRFGAARALRRVEHVPADARSRAMLFALGRLVLPMDDDMTRVLTRLRGAPETRRRQGARRWLSTRLQPELGAYKQAVVYLRHHARHTCVETAPHCTICPLRTECAHRGLTPI